MAEWIIVAFCVWLIYLINSDEFDAERYEVFFKIFLTTFIFIMVASLFTQFDKKTSAKLIVIIIGFFLNIIAYFLIYDLYVTGEYERAFVISHGRSLAILSNISYDYFGISGPIIIYSAIAIFGVWLVIWAYKALAINK